MADLMTILLALIIPFLWIGLSLTYLVNQARTGKLSPLKFSLVFILGFSITVSTILFVAIISTYGIGLREVSFVLFVLILNLVIGFPAVLFLSKYLLGKYFKKWSYQINAKKQN